MVWDDGGGGGRIGGAVHASKLLWIGWASFLLCLVALLIKCVCGCRRNRIPNRGASDAIGGDVPVDSALPSNHSPDNQQPTVVIATTPGDDNIPSSEVATKRSIGGGGVIATATRSLPDLPVDLAVGNTAASGSGGVGGGGGAGGVVGGASGAPPSTEQPRNKLWPPSCLQGTNTGGADNNSELYATVEESASSKKNALVNASGVGPVSLNPHNAHRVGKPTAGATVPSILLKGPAPRSETKPPNRNSGCNDDYYRYLGSVCDDDDDDEEEEEVYATTTTSGSDSLSPYARLNGEHPYDQLQIIHSEHQYAQVGQHGGAPRLRGGGGGGTSGNTAGPSSAAAGSALAQSNAPANNNNTHSRRRRRFSSSGDHVPPTSSLGGEGDASGGAVYSSVRRSSVAGPIAAASAITGSVPANSDLPYMTPPLAALMASQQHVAVPQASTDQHQPQHFSGDSQDSSKGYTSISVREPLSRIRGAMRQQQAQLQVGRGAAAETRPPSSDQGVGGDPLSGGQQCDPHYATVSDDSDDMYAAIEEKNVAGPANVASALDTRDETDGAVGGPASASLGDHLTISLDYDTTSDTYAQIAPPPHNRYHTRQESSSSGCSLAAVSPGSPKREKRQANSPLPEPPPPLLDDMYAKVVKKRNNNTASARSPSASPESAGSLRGGYDLLHPVITGTEESDPNYEELSGAVGGVGEVAEPDYASLLRPQHRDVSSEPPYERVTDQEPVSLPHYETVTSPLVSQHYETMGSDCGGDGGLPSHYESGDGHPSHYETLNNPKKRRDGQGCQADGDEGQQPHYETVATGGGGAQQGCQLPHYETVRNATESPKQPAEEQPHYETVSRPSDGGPNFEHYEMV
ncbi:hypothetical protein AAG570_005996 [Ranatra chinensis]|uniref:Uncharacterized protein n=1 Tax=Ranatra chinensis TaxID=642074 RepID=A0ABD0XWR0_9HEMI